MAASLQFEETVKYIIEIMVVNKCMGRPIVVTFTEVWS